MNKKLDLNEIDMTYILGNGSIAIETGVGVFTIFNALELEAKGKYPFIVLSWMDKDLPFGDIENVEEVVANDRTLIIIKNLESLEILQESLNHCREILIEKESTNK